MNEAVMRDICLQCIDALPESSFDPEEFEYQWESFEAKCLLGKRITFGSRGVVEPERGLFSQDLDPTFEAVVISVISNLIYDVLKSRCSERPMRFAPLDALIEGMGEVGTRTKKTITDTYMHARAIIERHIGELGN